MTMKIIIHKLFIYNWAGKFNQLVISSVFLMLVMLPSLPVRAMDDFIVNPETVRWDQYSKQMDYQERKDYRDGMSYVISGSIALAGGLVGDTITHDYIEKGIYTIFQTIGIASIGYGAYTWKIGSADRDFYKTVDSLKLSDDQKTMIIRSYYGQKKLSEKNERFIKAITHGLIASLNFYSASRQRNETVQNSLAFIGGVNLLATIAYSFEF